MIERISRRHALQLGAAGTLGYLFTGPATSVVRAAGANNRLRVAGIGVGGKGSGDIEQAGRLMEVVALCDIDDDRLGKRAASWPSAKKFSDYRKLFDEMLKEIDAVVVSTPDHSHALPSVLAMRAGKHVYCQKPLAHLPFEARLMREVAARHGVCTQMGNQGSALNGLRRAVELIHAGTLGAIQEAHVWTNRPFKYWKQAPDVVSRPKAVPAPKHVHWDEWIGPARLRPYAVRADGKPAYHPHDWRGYWDFGTGALGDMACHTANMAFRALKLDAPSAVVAEAGPINPETYPAWAHITYLFTARGDQPACALHWYEGERDGQRMHPPRGRKAGRQWLDPGGCEGDPVQSQRLRGEVPPASGEGLRGDPDGEAGERAGRHRQGQRRLHEERVDGGDSGRRSEAGVLEFRFRGPAYRNDVAGQHCRAFRRTAARVGCGEPAFLQLGGCE
jgi:predicted dehydrogenase